MFPQTPGLLQHGDIEVGHTAPGFLILFHQAGELDGAGKPGRPGSDDHHVHLDGLGARRVPQNQPIERKVALVVERKNRWQDGVLLGVRKTVELRLVPWT